LGDRHVAVLIPDQLKIPLGIRLLRDFRNAHER
jgi:hypothetical protein